MDNLIGEFLTETNESLAALEIDARTLKQTPDSKELISSILRLMRTIKGASSFLGLARLEQAADKTENLMVRLRGGDVEMTPDTAALVVEFLGRIKIIIAETYTPKTPITAPVEDIAPVAVAAPAPVATQTPESAAFPALIVATAGENFAIAQSALRELIRVSPTSDAKIETINGAPYLRTKDQLLSLISLKTLLNGQTEDGGGKLIVVTEKNTDPFGIIVEQVFDIVEITSNPVSSVLKNLEMFSGHAVLANGSLAMILDPEGVAKVAAKSVSPVMATAAPAAEIAPAPAFTLSSTKAFTAAAQTQIQKSTPKNFRDINTPQSEAATPTPVSGWEKIVDKTKTSNDEPAQTRRVLLVDDSPFFRNMLTQFLKSAGFNVTTLDTPYAALRLREKGEQFDVIVSDIEMPKMDGFEFAKKLQDSNSAWRQTPIIALTATTDEQDIRQNAGAGFSHYIAKFDRDTLLSTLTEILCAPEMGAEIMIAEGGR